MTSLLLTVGNDLLGDDGAGPYLARLAQQPLIPGWLVEDGGDMPENRLHHVRDLAPQRVLIVDAADMGLPPGSLRLIPPQRIAGLLPVSTHAMPLTFLIDMLKEFAPQVDLLGVQPANTAFAAPLSPQVQKAMQAVVADLRDGRWPWPELEADESPS